MFAADEIEAALRARKYQVERMEEWRVDEAKLADLVVRFAVVDPADDPQFEKLAAEGFLLRNVPLENHRELVVLSMDAAGAMYGGLELAEQIRVSGVEGVKDTDRNPYMPLRGTKFNIPLDLRTPSYTDMGDSAQANIATVWDFEFWRAVSRSAGARPLQHGVAVEPASISVDGEGAGVSRRGAERRVALEGKVRRGLLHTHYRHRHAGHAGGQGSRPNNSPSSRRSNSGAA